MLRISLGLLLTFIFLIIFILAYHHYKDLFHPLCFFSLLSFLRYVPSTFSAEVDNFVVITDKGILVFALMTILSTFCVCCGYYFYIKKISHKTGRIVMGSINNKMFSYGLILFILGVISRIYFIIKSGGLSYILSNIQSKVSIVTGNGYLLAFGNFMTYGIILMMCSKYRKKTKKYRFLVNIFILMCIAVDLFLFAFMSDRTAPLRSLMIIVMAYHYNYKRIKVSSIITPKYLALIFSICFFIVSMPLLRNAEGFDSYGSISKLLTSAKEELNDVLYWFSYTGRDVYIFDHYNISNYWYGKNIMNFLTAPIPSSLLENKLPVDEGYYLSNSIKGYESAPPDTSFVYESSIPFDNQGILYTNFGVVGMIIGNFLVGIIYGKTYKFLVFNNYHPISIVISQVILYNFSFTSHDMVNVLLLIGFLLIPLYLTNSIRMPKCKVGLKKQKSIL